METATRSPALSGATPDGVPVSNRSPGSSVKTAVMKARSSGSEKMKSSVEACWRISPLRRVSRLRPASRSSSIAHDRADGTEGVEAFGARPLIVLILQVAGGHVVGKREAAHEITPGSAGPEVARAAADDDGELAFKVDALRDGRQADRAAGREQRRWRLEEDQGFGGHFVPELADVSAIVAADTDDLGRRDGRKEFGGAEGNGREIEVGCIGLFKGQAVGQILSRRGRDIRDPQFAVAVFNRSVVSLAVD